ncbi:hypothetical protein PYCC9005_003124 [Savitreella phatthalungensis]
MSRFPPCALDTLVSVQDLLNPSTSWPLLAGLLGGVLPILLIQPACLVFLIRMGWSWYARGFRIPSLVESLLLAYAATECIFGVWLYTRWLTLRTGVSGSGPRMPTDKLIDLLNRIFAVPCILPPTHPHQHDHNSAEDTLRQVADALDLEPNPNAAHSIDTQDAAELRKEQIRFSDRFRLWFMNASLDDLRRGDIADWFAWSAFNTRPSELSEEQTEVVDSLLAMLERRCGHHFPAGRNPAVKSIKLNLDDIPFVPRPALFYGLVWAMNAHLAYTMRQDGWALKHVSVDEEQFPYWYRPPAPRFELELDSHLEREATKPVLFLHGLGLGLAQYRNLVAHLAHTVGERAPLFVPVQGQVGMWPGSRHWCRPPSMASTTTALLLIADRHAIAPDTWRILSHSYGTIAHAWILKHPHLSQLAARHLMVDPICFRLWEADVCFNFLYRLPSTPNQLLMAAAVARELGVATAMHRAFWWPQNLLLSHHIHQALHPPPPSQTTLPKPFTRHTYPLTSPPDSCTSDSESEMSGYDTDATRVDSEGGDGDWDEKVVTDEVRVDGWEDGGSRFAVFLAEKDEIVNARAVADYLREAGLTTHFFHRMAHGQIIDPIDHKRPNPNRKVDSLEMVIRALRGAPM